MTKISKTITVVFILFTTLGFSQSGQKNFIDQPYIEVTGTIETEIIPNEIFLRIILDENDKKGKQSVEKQEKLMIATLESLSIDLNKNFSILDFNGTYTRKFFGDNEVTKIKHYQLIVNDGKTLGEVYQALDACDISNISITKTSHTELEKFRRETKLKALKTAKEKANDYANAIGQNIGKALFIQEIKNTPNHNYYANNLNVANGVNFVGHGSEKNKIHDLNLKSITITETVMAKFTLI